MVRLWKSLTPAPHRGSGQQNNLFWLPFCEKGEGDDFGAKSAFAVNGCLLNTRRSRFEKQIPNVQRLIPSPLLKGNPRHRLLAFRSCFG